MLHNTVCLSKVRRDYLNRAWQSVHGSLIFIVKVPEISDHVAVNGVLIPLVLCLVSS